MQPILANLYIYVFILMALRGCSGQSGFCKRAKQKQHDTQVVAICTDNFSTKRTRVFIDTSKVYELQRTICECTITPSDAEIEINFAFYDSKVTKGATFTCNNLVLNETIKNGTTFIMDVTSLRLVTSSYFEKDGACLVVESVKEYDTFNITCAQPETNVSISTTPRQDVEKELPIIVPVMIASVSSVGMLIVIPLGVFCKRRFKSKHNQSITLDLPVPREDQVFYNVVSQSRDSGDAHDYNYIDPIDFGGNHYNTLSEQEYDSTFNTIKKSQTDCKLTKCESKYDTLTDNKDQFNQNADNYHHVDMFNVRKADIEDKYNTINVTGKSVNK